MTGRHGADDGSVDVEICTQDSGGPAAAQSGGADGIELCAALSEGGLTPSLGMVRHARRTAPDLALQVLVRPRAGDFTYSPDELAIMISDIHTVRSDLADPGGHGGHALGFTVGALIADGSVDTAAMADLVAACGPAPVTFHKAFDALADQRRSLEDLIELGVRTVLTAGGPGPAVDHLPELAALVRQARGRITVRVGGGVRPANVAEIIRATGVRAIHLRAPREVPSPSRTGPTTYDPGSREITSADVVTQVVAAARALRPA